MPRTPETDDERIAKNIIEVRYVSALAAYAKERLRQQAIKMLLKVLKDNPKK